MDTKTAAEFLNLDAQEFSENFVQASERYQRMITELVGEQGGSLAPAMDPFNLSKTMVEFATHWISDPVKVAEAQIALFNDMAGLWQNMALRAMGQPGDPYIEPDRSDRRFKSDDWSNNQVFDFIKQSYLVVARWFESTVKDAEGLNEHEQHKLEFFTKQFVDAMSPSNFILTNPDVLRKTVESGGENLVKGFQNILHDLEEGGGKLAISSTDKDAFDVGRNVATTPGKVVYQNDILQLIQYTPTTEEVYQRPLLIMPPWINKYYILDLQPGNSYVRWCLDQGYTVFVVSWVNPDEKLADKTFEDYMFEGPLACLDAIEKATGEKSVNVIGYCIGGTLLAATLAYMAEKGDKRFNAATFFTAQVDFTEAGDLMVFIDEEQLKALENKMAEKGYLESKDMQETFNMLRSNDLIWSFVVNNYMLGRDPMPFDLLYWNADSTRMPRELHSFYLRKMYHENKLAEPGGITLGGVPIDLTKIKTPIFMQAGREDHIAPFTSVFKGVNHFSGPTEFMLAGSGHIAGVINHPDAKKYQYWTNPDNPKDLETWLAGAKEHPGSWWPYWHKWLSKKSGRKVPARQPGDGKLKVIEDAPGSYVKAK